MLTEQEIEELIQLLVRLILEGSLSEDEANAILDEVRSSGKLPEGFQLPLPLELAIPEELSSLVTNFLTLEVGTHYSIEAAQTNFENRIDEITRDLIRGQITLKSWQEKFIDALIEYLSTAAAAGAQTDITGTPRENPVLEMVRVQLAYLSRFADSYGLGMISAGQALNRGVMYSGQGRALFYQQEGISNADAGWVIDYIAVDDRYTCEPCRQAEERGPYLPDDAAAPLPGSVCLGRGYCRCVRALRYDPQTYLRLSGVAVTA